MTEGKYLAAVNRGTEHLLASRFDDAIAAYDLALAEHPDDLDALRWKGDAYRETKRMSQALECYGRALQAWPGDAVTLWHKAMTHLSLGDYDEGCRLFERRWDVFPQFHPEFACPKWMGETLSGKSILLWAEQGFGDTLQFCRYAPLVAGTGAKVVLRVQPALKRLLSDQWPGITVLSERDPVPETDYHCPLLSVPLLMGNFFPKAPYLWAEIAPPRLPAGRKVGLCWFSNRGPEKERHRSVTLDQLAPVLKADATFYSLQVRRRSIDDGLHGRLVSQELKDFADTAALIAEMDLVISVDTSVAHLAAAMGKPTWTLIPYVGTCWRWLLDRTDSPWYPTMTLFRQKRVGEWGPVIDDIAARLAGEMRNAA